METEVSEEMMYYNGNSPFTARVNSSFLSGSHNSRELTYRLIARWGIVVPEGFDYPGIYYCTREGEHQMQGLEDMFIL